MRDLAMAMIAARVIDARSKLATARALNPPSAVTTVGKELGLGEVDQHELYAAMDWIGERQRGIEGRLASWYLSDNTLVLYDLTSCYLKGTRCPLAQRGYSRDGKKGKRQELLAATERELEKVAAATRRERPSLSVQLSALVRGNNNPAQPSARRSRRAGCRPSPRTP